MQLIYTFYTFLLNSIHVLRVEQHSNTSDIDELLKILKKQGHAPEIILVKFLEKLNLNIVQIISH